MDVGDAEGTVGLPAEICVRSGTCEKEFSVCISYANYSRFTPESQVSRSQGSFRVRELRVSTTDGQSGPLGECDNECRMRATTGVDADHYVIGHLASTMQVSLP